MLKYADYLTGKGIGMAEVGEVMLYSAFYLIPQIVPISVLVASLISFGTLGEHNELTAIKSAGVSLIKIIMPVLVFVLLLSAALYKYNDVVLPRINIKVWSLLHDISQKKAPFSLKEGVFSEGLSGYTIKVEERLDEGHTLKGIMIYQKSGKHAKRNDRLVVADSGKMYNMNGDRYLVLELFNGEEYREDAEIMKWGKNKNKPYLALAHSKFERSKIVIDMSELALHHTPEERFMGHKRMKTYDQIWEMSDSLHKGYDRQINKLFKNLQPYYTYHFKTPNNNIVLDSFDFSRVDLNGKQILQKATQLSRSLNSTTKSFKDSLKHYTWTAANFEIEAWSRYNFSISCVLLFLIGASIGAIVKKGGLGIPILIAILIFVVYYILSSHGNKLAKELVVDVEVGMMLCNMVLLPLAVFCLVIAAKDGSFSSLNIFKLFPNAIIHIKERSGVVRNLEGQISSDEFEYIINTLDTKVKNAKSWNDFKDCENFKEKSIQNILSKVNSTELLHRVNRIPKLGSGMESMKMYYLLKNIGKHGLIVSMVIAILIPLISFVATKNWVSSFFITNTIFTFLAIYKTMIEKNGISKLYNLLFILFGLFYFLPWVLFKLFQDFDLRNRFSQTINSLKSVRTLYEAERK